MIVTFRQTNFFDDKHFDNFEVFGYETGFAEPRFDENQNFFHIESSTEVKQCIYYAFNYTLTGNICYY